MPTFGFKQSTPTFRGTSGRIAASPASSKMLFKCLDDRQRQRTSDEDIETGTLSAESKLRGEGIVIGSVDMSHSMPEDSSVSGEGRSIRDGGG